ncbi:MAG: adenylate kinase [Clostridia bacterium]|nr:adenylate kinase [Clostridia bacterium]
MKLIMLGAPGAGKGTQAAELKEKLSIPAISTGAIIRNAIKSGTQVGIEAKKYIDNGQLVPDDVVIRLLDERISMPDCVNGFILDGFPRTIAQAKALDDKKVDIDYVISLHVDDEVIMERLSGRRECPKCAATYHVVMNPSSKGEFCDKCGEALVTRADDNPETIAKRLAVYHEQTEPLIKYYEETGKLVTVVGKDDVRHTTEEVFKAIGYELV